MRGKKSATFLILMGCIFLLTAMPGCINRTGIYVGGPPEPKGGPPPHAPAHGYRAKHTYHYYPSAHVYFDISRKVYFYMEVDRWTMSVSLPSRFHLEVGEYVAIEMNSDRPYTEFDKHKKKYPPGQLKKKKNKKWVHKE